MSRKLFINLPVADVARSKAFFAALGFTFDAQFTDDSAACLVVSDEAFVMLVSSGRFAGFVRRPPADPGKTTAALYAFSVGARADVDRLAGIALERGGAPAAEPADHGFMVSRSFYDPDGHHWEVFWMDPARLVT